jgi:hypothetical protein
MIKKSKQSATLVYRLYVLRNTARTAIKKNERWIYKCSSKYVSFSNIIDPLTSSSYNCISQAELVREKNIARRETCVNHILVSPDPHHCYADPDPFFQVLCGSGSGSDSSLKLGSGSCSSSKWCESATTGPQSLQGSILNIQASIVSVHGPTWLHLEPKKTLTLMQIWIQLFNLMRIRLFQK